MPTKYEAANSAYADMQRPAPEPRREADWTASPHDPGPMELAFTVTFSTLIVLGLIYAAAIIAWGDLAIGYWKPATFAALTLAAFPFLSLAWRDMSLLHAAIDHRLADHYDAIHRANHARDLDELQLASIKAAMLQQQQPTPMQIGNPDQRAPTILLPNDETINAKEFAAWAAADILTLENATYNNFSRPMWEGACDWLSDRQLATETSQGKTGKLLVSPDAVRARILDEARPWYQIKSNMTQL
jgi:hypothetical protein